MARFIAYAESGPEYLLDCQADQLSHLQTRFVIPLLPVGDMPREGRLQPVFLIGAEQYVMVTHLASAIPARELRRRVADLSEHHTTIINAIDMLTTGY